MKQNKAKETLSQIELDNIYLGYRFEPAERHAIL